MSNSSRVEVSPQPRLPGRDRGSRLGAFIVDRRGTILGFDQEMEQLTGWPAVDVVGRNKDLSLSVGLGTTAEHPVARPLYAGSLPVPSGSERVELRLNCADGRSIDVETVATRLPGAGDRVAVAVHRILARSAGPSGGAGISECDSLTDLPGPEAFRSCLAASLKEAAVVGRPLALVLADVDHFRRINDRMGHPAGDDVLRKLAGILRAAVPDGHSVARLCDDDFALLLPGSGRGEARQLAARLRTTVERFRFYRTPSDVSSPQITLSLGAASYPADADNERDLMERAREALEEARSFGRNRVWCYLRRPRVPVHVPVYFDGADSMLVGFSRDLSPSGIFVQTRSLIEIGMRCALSFPLPGAEANIHVIGRVVRAVPVQPGGQGVGEQRIAGMGIEFERLGPSDRGAIEAFLHRNEATTLRPEDGTFSL